MKLDVCPGDFIEWVYLLGRVPVEPNDTWYSTPMQRRVPIHGPALLVGLTVDTLTWLSVHGLFTVHLADTTMHFSEFSTLTVVPRKW